MENYLAHEKRPMEGLWELKLEKIRDKKRKRKRLYTCELKAKATKEVWDKIQSDLKKPIFSNRIQIEAEICRVNWFDAKI